MNQFLKNHQLYKAEFGVNDESISVWISGSRYTFFSSETLKVRGKSVIWCMAPRCSWKTFSLVDHKEASRPTLDVSQVLSNSISISVKLGLDLSSHYNCFIPPTHHHHETFWNILENSRTFPNILHIEYHTKL